VFALWKVAGCSTPPGTPGLEATADPARGCPFSAVSVRVHPLTHAERDASGQTIIVLHVEPRDAWGEATKATGQLSVTLSRVGAGPGPTLDDQELTWRDDLTDLSRNVRLWDPATRTYRVPLGQLPTWAVAETSEGAASMRLAVALSTRDRSGEERVLQDTFVLRR